MKKIILGSICGLLALTMVGCGTSSQDAAIKNLSKQLDRVTNTVSSMSTAQFEELSPTSYLAKQTASRQYSENYKRLRPINNSYTGYNNSGYVASQIYKMEASANEQETLKQNIINQTAMLKSELGKKLKLSKNQVKAINNLTNTICKYTTNLNSTKTDINNSIKNISRVKKASSYNEEQAGSYYQSLNNHLDARLCYFRNLINTIDQVQNILGCEECNENQNNQNQNNEVYYQNQNNGQTNNIDTYQTNIPTSQVAQNNGYNNNYNNGYNYGYNNGYNNGYNYNNGYVRNNTFNPNRNTDTYAPRVRNIDTYRNYPNQGIYNNYNTTIPASNPIEEAPEVNDTEPVENNEKQENKIIKGTIITKKNGNEKEPVKTQEVKRYHSINSQNDKTLSLLDIDHTQTNKKIEKLVRG